MKYLRKKAILCIILFYIGVSVFLSLFGLDFSDSGTLIICRRVRWAMGSWDISVPERAPFRYRGKDEIRASLDTSGYNWYWDVLTEEAREEVLNRLDALKRLPEFLKKRFPEYRIKSVIVKRGFLFGFGSQNRYHLDNCPYDLDLTLIVEGNCRSSPGRISLSDEEVKEIFGPEETRTRYTRRLDVKVFGEVDLVDYFGDFNARNTPEMGDIEKRVMSDRGSGITLAGPIWYNETPPEILWLGTIRSAVDEANGLIRSAIQNDAEYYFSEEIQGEYKYLSEKDDLTIAEEQRLKALQGGLSMVEIEFGKGIRRLTEAGLRINYFIEHIRPDMVAEIGKLYNVDPDSIFSLPRVVATTNRIIEEGLTEEFYHQIFSEKGILAALEALESFGDFIQAMNIRYGLAI